MIVEKALDGVLINEDEIATLFEAPLFSTDSALIISASRQKSEKASDGLAEVHGQIGLNIAPCPKNCLFCAFAACNNVFTESSELSVEEVISRARQYERDGANAVYLMSTAQYDFDQLLEIGRETRRSLKDTTVLVANAPDMNEKQALQLKDAGFAGVYHALRLGEGRDTKLDPKKRLETFENVKNVGLKLGTCVEPVGPEHDIRELVEKTVITQKANPVYSGSARRIPIPGTKLAENGAVSEARMAQILAVVRLAMGYDTPGNCTHEPNTIGASAGANLLWAETGSNPRDVEEDTANQRGMSVLDCHQIYKEAEWNILDGPSRFYSND